MTDGSLATFKDTFRVPVRSACEFIVCDDFECIPDRHVKAGDLTVYADSLGYEGESEWAIRFPKPISQYAGVSREALAREKLAVVGVIEGKALSRLGESTTISWASSSVGNNVITTGEGFEATLGELRQMKAGTLWLEATFHTSSGRNLRPPRGRKYWRRADIADSEVQNLLKPENFHSLITTLAKYSQDDAAPFEVKQANLVNLSALGADSAAVNNRWYRMLAIVPAVAHFIANRFSASRTDGDYFRDLLRARTVVNLVAFHDCLPPEGGSIRLTFHHPNGADAAVLNVVLPPE